MTGVLQKISISTVLAFSATAYAGWEQLSSMPDSRGVAAAFVGVSGKSLLLAGGTNFPDKAPWDGGKKQWYDAVYALNSKSGEWKTAGTLPHPLGYGVSVTVNNRMLCVGGNDADRCYADAFWLDYDGSKLTTTGIPNLPAPLTNASGACAGSILYIAGGQTSNDATSASQSVFAIDLADRNARWKALAPLPGNGRILATAAAFDGSFYVLGGAALSEAKDHSAQREYLSDAYKYTPDAGWKRLADLPNPIVAAPSPAPVDAEGFFILGGDDGSHVGFKPPTQHPGFSKTILHFDVSTGRWSRSGEMPAARVTVPCVPWNDGWVIPGGEMKPGVRSPQVWMFTPKDAK